MYRQIILYIYIHMDVSKNKGTPKSSILVGFSFINHPFWGTPIFGNPHISYIRSSKKVYISMFNHQPSKPNMSSFVFETESARQKKNQLLPEKTAPFWNENMGVLGSASHEVTNKIYFPAICMMYECKCICKYAMWLYHIVSVYMQITMSYCIVMYSTYSRWRLNHSIEIAKMDMSPIFMVKIEQKIWNQKVHCHHCRIKKICKTLKSSSSVSASFSSVWNPPPPPSKKKDTVKTLYRGMNFLKFWHSSFLRLKMHPPKSRQSMPQ